jgi:hypothetical protein
MRWVIVYLPHATFALAAEDGVIVEAAPIARWTLGKQESAVAAYYRSRGALFRRF